MDNSMGEMYIVQEYGCSKTEICSTSCQWQDVTWKWIDVT